MEVHAVSGGWVLEWSGCTGSSIVKATVGVAGFLVVVSGVVQGVRHRSLRWYSLKGRLARDNNKEPDAAMSNQAMKELEGEIGSASQAPDNQPVAMATARASDLPLLDVSGADSPRGSRIGRGLESIGGLTADTLQRLSTAVGGVVKSPVVLMAKVGGLASPRAATLTAPLGSSLEERVFHLEIQMKRFEEKFSLRTVVTKLDLSPCSHIEKPRISKSPLQEMETEGTLAKRVQMLEDRLNERMERMEETLSSIQSQLDHAEFSSREIVVGYERQESLSGEPQYYDAEQQSDNFEALEDLKHNFFDAHDVSRDATGGSPILEKSHVKETSSAAPTLAEHVEPLQEIYTGNNDDYLEPKEVSTLVYPKEAFLAQSMKFATPSSEPAEIVQEDDSGNLMASSDLQLASSLEELHGPFVTESSVAGASAEFLDIARADTAKKTTLAQASSKPQSVFVLEHQEDFLEEPSTAILVAKFGEHAQEDDVDKSGTTTTATESPLPPTFEAIKKNFVKEPLVPTPNAKPSLELTTQEDGVIALASSELGVASKSVEEPPVAIPSANFEELAQEDISDKSVTMTTIGESPNAFAFQDPQEDSMKESLASTPIVGPIHEPSSQEDLNTTSDMALASSPSSMASKSMEDPLATTLGTNFEEPTQEDSVDKSANTIAAAELPLVSSLEEPREESAKELMAIAPSVEFAQVLATQESNDIQVATPELQRTSKFVEEPSAVAPSADSEEPSQEDVAKKIGTTMATTKLSLASSLEEPKGGFEKESIAFAPSAGLAHETSSLEHLGATSDVALASSELAWGSKFVEEPLPNILSANSKEPAKEDGAAKSDTMVIGVKSPLFEEPHEDFEKESMATISGIELAQELASQEEIEEEFVKDSLVASPNVGLAHELLSQEDLDATSDMAFASSTPHLASKFVEKPSLDISSANSKDHVQDKDVVKSDTMSATVDSLLASSFEEPQEDFEKESLASTSSNEPTQGLATEEDSHMVPTSFESREASKSMEEPLTITPSANFEEPAREDAVDESVALTTAGVSPFTSSFEETQEHMEDYTEESSAAGASAKVLEPIEDDESGKSPIAFAPLEAPSSFMPQEAFLEEPSRTSVQPVQEKSGIVLPDIESTLPWTVEEGNQTTKEAEYKLAEDFKVRNDVGFDELKPESLVAEDNDQSSEEFFDAEHGSGNFEPWESVAPKSFEEFSVAPNEPGEATGINVVAQKETLEPTSSMEVEQARVREFAQEPEEELARELEHDHKSVERAPVEELEQHSTQEPEQRSIQEHGQQPMQELEQEDLIRNSAMALPPLEPQVTSKSKEPQELLAEEPLAIVPSIKFEETAQANVTDKSGTHDLPLTSTTKEPQIDTVVSLGKSLSSASFHQSSNLELLENLKYKSLDTPSTSSTPQEVLERESLTTTPTTEIAHRHDSGKSDNVHILLEPQLEESREALVNEPMKIVQNSESTKPAQEVDDGRSGATLTSLEPQLTPTMQELHEGFEKEPVADVESTSKSVNLEEALADEPLAVTTSAKLAQESTIDKISVGLVEEPPLTSIAKKPQNGSVDSLVEGKHGQDEVNQKFLEDVKIIVEPIEEAIPRTQSDLTHVKLKSDANEDATKLQNQGSFLAFGATSVDSKEAMVKELLPSAKLLELFEEENNFGKRGPILADSPATSRVEEPQKPLVEEPLAGAKSIPKGHARRRGFARSSSEPQFAYKLEEHRKTLPKESSVVVDPSASKLGKKHAQEDFADIQCLPFRILGEGKHPRKESEFNLMEDVKSLVTKSETTSSYVLEPKPSKIKEKKKKEKKPDAIAEEKERRLSLGLGEMERKSSLRAEEKDNKYLPRAEEKPKQPFRHLRDRLRHAFSINKEP